MNKKLFILYLLIKIANAFLGDILYRIAHIGLAITIAFTRYSQSVTMCTYIFFHLLALELVAETIIFPREKRRKYYADGIEILSELKEELKKKEL